MLQLLCFFGVTLAFAAPEKPSTVLNEVEGKVFLQETFPHQKCPDAMFGVPCSEPSFGRYHWIQTQDGEFKHSVTEFFDVEGVQAREESWEKSGQVQRAIFHSRALGVDAEMSVMGKEIHFQRTDKKTQKKQTETEAHVPNLVVPSTVMSYISPYFKEILEGKEIPLRVGVFDRKETIGFFLRKKDLSKAPSGDEILVLEMKATSPIIRAFVPTMSFYVKLRTKELFAFEGRSALLRKNGEKYDPIMVRTLYQYKKSTQTPLIPSGGNIENSKKLPN